MLMPGWIVVTQLMLPAQWDSTLVLDKVKSQGLVISSWQVVEPYNKLRRWLADATFCEPLSSVPGHDWHCLNETTLFSLLTFDDQLVWVQSQRAAIDIVLPYNLRGQIVGSYHNAFERVYVFRTTVAPHTLAVEFAATQQRRGAQQTMDEQDISSFMQRWSLGNNNLILSAQRAPSGLTVAVLTEGTTL